jgi:hypothetical protein
MYPPSTTIKKENTMLSERSHSKKAKSYMISLHEMSRIGKSIETEAKLRVV